MKRRVFLACLAQAIGGLRWLLFPISNLQDRQRRQYRWGWAAPEMDEHWQRAAEADTWHDWYEALKNVVSEWARLDPTGKSIGQRASKILLAWAAIAVVITALVCLAIGGGVVYILMR